MTNTPWEAASPHYKKLVFSAMGLIGLGIILTIIGSLSHIRPVVYVAIGLLAVGMICHLAGLVVRARDTRNWRIANELVRNPREAKDKQNKSGS
ncbi:hypothetical protein AUR04nite_26420 [Glutamicibacter uratoxydans]|uniref:DUF3188 domain-containing protein n=1 Tax=Glutamicibacter uratoxydans TaxID=43667 RepID=A0A4Y4DUH3_GLUUR|nr:hypothetical protein [Glutamicibacter uratoxydans]GED07110.1 hypothetical protein AUR04nite_26420 [Glutamicibacter uratoxydans]